MTAYNDPNVSWVSPNGKGIPFAPAARVVPFTSVTSSNPNVTITPEGRSVPISSVSFSTLAAGSTTISWEDGDGNTGTFSLTASLAKQPSQYDLSSNTPAGLLQQP